MLQLLKNLLVRLYMHYELITCISVLEPWEKKLINGFVVLIMGLIAYSSFVYLPSYMETFLHFVSPLHLDAAKGPAAPYTPMLQPEKISMG